MQLCYHGIIFHNARRQDWKILELSSEQPSINNPDKRVFWLQQTGFELRYSNNNEIKICYQRIVSAVGNQRRYCTEKQQEKFLRPWLYGRVRQSQVRQTGQGLRRMLSTLPGIRRPYLLQVQLLQK
ncbi:hypothetical protein TNIN_32771 [Trichonephila inaurata madagascariensis]|uniref:Uncharacterized protein n=1 Tax=Trichonephila inaurata madagascariensis TaxID=2747483 RepID=A0A8X7BNA5_9ARAC|nr:hypothetical protein TNIN_32771 [Trichonephila inaurata madagascariensis]